jgi:hypothetical protein
VTASRSRGSSIATAAGVIAISLMLTFPAAATRDPAPDVVASRLLNPRGIGLGDDGAILVAEAGKGGDGPCQPGPEGGSVCVGLTGRLTRIAGGDLDRLVTLPSHAGEDGSAALGPHDVALAGENGGGIIATIGLGGDPGFRDGFGSKGRLFGTLVRVSRSGDVRVIADLAAYEAAVNPAGDIVDSNPFGLLRREERTIVTDAGGNSLLGVTDGGRVRTIAVFPSRLVPFGGDVIPMHAVPTSVVRGPDGAFYVGQLTGFPFPVGGARVYRVERGEEPEVFARGFTNIIDIAFHRGKLYVLEIAHNGLLSPEPFGALIRVNADGSKTVLFDDLFFPGGFAFAGRDTVLVTNCGVCPGGGEVLKLRV